jgi:hypothetical protein
MHLDITNTINLIFLSNHQHYNVDDDLLTVSSLTDDPSNLTEIFHNSTLPGSHDSRRTYTNFLVRADKLPNCVLTPKISDP